MKLTSVIVWYNPLELKSPHSAVANIHTYSAQFDKVYIVDNSNTDNSKIAQKISNAVYIPLMKNYGIAYALNRGFEKAISDGFDWVMTMDQDSFWETDEIKKYLKWVQIFAAQNSNAVSFSTRAVLKSKSLVGILKRICYKKFKQRKTGVGFVNRVICSANIVKTDCWKEIGGFNEELFIDEVDYEFCYRIRQRQYQIVINYDIFFHHSLGNDKLTLLPHKNIHSDFRLYYIFRNLMYIIEKYPVYASEYKYSNRLSYLIRSTCIFDLHFRKHRKILEKAKSDFQKMITN
ncbi:MAG: glycosyltransferase [Bacteroidales bacterium]|nr:glycosyltransferase [Bacteroidales bacterium]